MSARGGRRQFFTGRNGTSRVSSDPSGLSELRDLEKSIETMKASIGLWNRFMDSAGGSFQESSNWQGKFIPVSGNTRISVQWRDSFGIPHQTQVRWDRLQRDGSLAILRAANGERQVAINEAVRRGKQPPRLGRAYKKSDFVGASYYIFIRSDAVYVS